MIRSLLLLMFGGFLLSCQSVEKRSALHNSYQDGTEEVKSAFVEANGINFHVLKKGKGELVLFLHGFPEYSGMWTPFLEDLGEDYFVVAPDMRGYNLTSAPKAVDQYSIETLTQDIAALIKALGYTKAKLVAHDWGGVVAWYTVSRFPELFEQLVIMNAPHPQIYTKLYQGDADQQKSGEYIKTLISPTAEETLSADNYAWLRRAVFETSKKPYTPEEQEGYLTAWKRNLTGSLNYYRSYLPNVARDINFMKKIDLPVLVLWGESDQALSIKNLDGLSTWVPQVTIKRFANTSHWIAHERSRECITEIRSFFDN